MSKFLLYIDILGFSELLKDEQYSKIEMIFKIVNSLNVYSHHAFNTIVFSDTILVYNNFNPQTKSDNEYSIMYLVEFAQDLQYRLTGLDTYFRAIIVNGKFHHSKLTNLDAYWGESLVRAYKSEKELPAIGIFLEEKLLEFNVIFDSIRFNNTYFYIFPLQSIRILEEHVEDDNVMENIAFYEKEHIFDEMLDGGGYLISDIKFLEGLYLGISKIQDANIRSKYVETFRLYSIKYPIICKFLISNNFTLPIKSWLEKIKMHNDNANYYSNIR